MTFCKSVCPWAIRQSSQWSTWRGLAIGIGSIVAVVNPALIPIVAKAVAGAISVIDIAKDDTK